MSYLRKSYDILAKIIKNGAYINIAINDIVEDDDRPLVTKIVYGTIEHYFECNYIINALSDTPPKPSIRIVLLQAVYCLRYLSIPSYAIVDGSVNLVAEINKVQLKGYVNAILNKVAKNDYALPTEKQKDYLEVKYNLPLWLIKEIKKEYPKAYTTILAATGREEEHVRLSPRLPDTAFTKSVGNSEKTLTGYFVRNTEAVKDFYEEGLLTYQSLTSTYAVLALGELNGKSVLDVCSAPGGKAVFAAERGGIVTACDLYPHRVDLIEDYAERMGVRLNAVVKDGATYKKEWNSKYDFVMVDAPCSGLGVLSKRRDIALKRSLMDIGGLVEIQKKLLAASCKYVKIGGCMLYSTCTILKAENHEVVYDFLQKNSNFEYEEIPLPYKNGGELQFLANNNGLDGFYIARLKRIK